MNDIENNKLTLKLQFPNELIIQELSASIKPKNAVYTEINFQSIAFRTRVKPNDLSSLIPSFIKSKQMFF